MGVTTIANMQIVPEKFSKYVIDRTIEKSALVNAGIATADAVIGSLINGVPEGGRFIEIPMWNPLEGDPDVFGEDDVSVGGITTKEGRATLLMFQRAWGSSDLAHVLGGADPMAAIGNQIGDWRLIQEQKLYLAILSAILSSTTGALKDHVNDVSTQTGDKSIISVGNTLDTKQTLGDASGILGMVFMHSATYTQLQKNQQITTEYDATLQISIQTYLGYRVVVDDGMPAAEGIYDTYFLGSGAFIRQDGTPQGFIGTETDRDKIGAKNYLINRWCQIVHPRGFSWVNTGTYTNPKHKYPDVGDLAKAENWELIVEHKKIPIACLRHKLSV